MQVQVARCTHTLSMIEDEYEREFMWNLSVGVGVILKEVGPTGCRIAPALTKSAELVSVALCYPNKKQYSIVEDPPQF